MLVGGLLLAAYGPAGMPPTGCAPGYLALDPDASFGATYLFHVKVTEPTRAVRWSGVYVYASRLCCEQVRTAVADVLRHLVAPDRGTVTLDEACR